MNTKAVLARTMLTGSLLALSGGLGGCGNNEAALPKAVVQSFERAFNADDLDATVALFDDDAQILREGGPIITGRDDISAFIKDQMTPVISYNTEADMTIVRNDIAIEQGIYRVRDVRRGSDIEEGKYLHVWRNRGSGWKIYRVIYNTDVAPDTEVSIAQGPEDSA